MSNNTETEDVEVESSATDNNGWDFVEDTPVETDVSETNEEPVEEPSTEEEVEEAEESSETNSETEVEDSDNSESESEEEEKEEAEPVKKDEPRIPLSRLRKEIMKRKAAEAKLQKPEVKEKQEPQSGEPDFPALTYDAEVDRQNQAKYYKDLAAYERNQLKEELALEKRQIQQAEREAADLRRIEEAKESDPEYRQALEDVFSDEEETEFVTSQMTQDLYEAIQEFGTPLEKYVLQNRHELMPKLADLQGRSFDREIGRIMGRLEAAPEKTAPAPKKPKQKSKAPPAIKQVTKGTSKVQPVADGWKIE